MNIFRPHTFKTVFDRILDWWKISQVIWKLIKFASNIKYVRGAKNFTMVFDATKFGFQVVSVILQNFIEIVDNSFITQCN